MLSINMIKPRYIQYPLTFSLLSITLDELSIHFSYLTSSTVCILTHIAIYPVTILLMILVWRSEEKIGVNFWSFILMGLTIIPFRVVFATLNNVVNQGHSFLSNYDVLKFEVYFGSLSLLPVAFGLIYVCYIQPQDR